MRRRISKKKEFEVKLEEEFPFMRRREITGEQREKGGYSSYEAYGCDVNEGWYKVLRGLCLDITKAYEEANMPVDIIVEQVKEKFGTLRFYCYHKGHHPGIFAIDAMGEGSLRKKPGQSYLHKKVAEIVSKWEKESANVCERCGTPGKTRTDLRWVLTLCDSCYAESIANQEERERQRKKYEENPELREAERKAELEEKRKQTLTAEDVASMTGDEQLTIPARAKYIDEKVFDAFTRLKHIYVDESNETYKSDDGVLLEYYKPSNNMFIAMHERAEEVRCSLVRYPAEKAQVPVHYSIPKGVHIINDTAFKGCVNVIGITVPDTVDNIRWGAFSDSGIRDIFVDPDNLEYSSVDGVLYSKYKTQIHAYPPMKDSDYYIVPDDVRVIWHHAFQNARNLTRIVIPKGIGLLGNGAFDGCISLKGITIPCSACFNERERVFYDCPSLERIEVNKEGNEKRWGRRDLYGEDGVLFREPYQLSRHKKGEEEERWTVHILMRYPEANLDNSYAIPQGITHILTYAFSRQLHLRSIIIPESVTDIGEGAFEGCHEDLTLHCAENSYAHEYAKKEGIAFELV